MTREGRSNSDLATPEVIDLGTGTTSPSRREASDLPFAAGVSTLVVHHRPICGTSHGAG